MAKSKKRPIPSPALIERLEKLERRVEAQDEAILRIQMMLWGLAKPVRTNAISPMANVGSNPLRGLV